MLMFTEFVDQRDLDRERQAQIDKASATVGWQPHRVGTKSQSEIDLDKRAGDQRINSRRDDYYLRRNLSGPRSKAPRAKTLSTLARFRSKNPDASPFMVNQ